MIPQILRNRTINGASAILVPLDSSGAIDWPAFGAHLDRTIEAGLAPAVNMDTGYVQLLSSQDRAQVLKLTAERGVDFFAGAFVADQSGAALNLDAYRRECEAIESAGGTPVIFPSHGLNELAEPDLIEALGSIGAGVDRFLGFELGPMFVPYGRIYSLDGYAAMMQIESCIGAKHSSLSREQEWSRLALRDEKRPQFRVYTGNDLAIDMVMYGSDYLLGLSTFAPAEFALRDRYWAQGDPRFYELNDLLQYLGHFTFRDPVPAYRHDAAMFFELRGWAHSSLVPSGAPTRPDSDRDVLANIAERLGDWTTDDDASIPPHLETKL